MRALITIVFSGLLAACGGGGGGPGGGSGGGGPGGGSANFLCSTVGGGSATASTSCVNCPRNNALNIGQAIDGNLDTAATLSVHNPDEFVQVQSQISLRGTAQSGVIFPTGSRAGVALKLPTGSNVVFNALVNTYLDGILQDSVLVEPGHSGAANGEIIYYGFDEDNPTLLEFDAVELSIIETAPGLEEHVYEIFEICSDGQRTS